MFLLGVLLVCLFFFYLVWDDFYVCISSCLHPRSVLELVWVMGPLISVAQDTFPDLYAGYSVVLGVFRVIFFLVFAVHSSLFHASSSPPPPSRVTCR